MMTFLHRSLPSLLLFAAIGWFALPARADSPLRHADIDVALLGDGNTWIGGDACDKPQGWNYWWRESFGPRSCRSYARSGATWTNTTRTRRNVAEDTAVLGHDNVIYNQVCRLIEAVEAGAAHEPRLIVIGAGTNDAWFGRRRPGVFADDPAEVDPATVTALRPAQATSLARSVMLSCAMLRKRFPRAVIVLLTPHQTTATTPSNIARVSDIIERCGRRMNIHVIRQDLESGISASDERRKPTLTTDGTHTSIDGARHVARFLDAKITEIVDD